MFVGNIATGENFFDRKRELDDLRLMLAHDHVVLSGCRRLGKSSVLNRLREQLEAEGFPATHLSVEDASTAEAFVEKLDQAIPEAWLKQKLESASHKVRDFFARIEKVEGRFAGAGGGIDIAPAAASPQWPARLDAVFDRLRKHPAIVMIDEFSVFLARILVHDKAQAEQLCARMRSWRNRPDMQARLVYSGSISLPGLLEEHRVSTTFNDCAEFELGPFTERSAEQMVVTVAERSQYEITPDQAATLCRRVGWLSPYFVNRLFAATTRAASDRYDELALAGPRRIEDVDIDNGFESLVGQRSLFIHWDQRLDRSPDAPVKRRCLKAIADADAGLPLSRLSARLAKLLPDAETRRDTLKRALRQLGDEGYLSPPDAEGRYLFRSFLLAAYWKRHE